MSEYQGLNKEALLKKIEVLTQQIEAQNILLEQLATNDELTNLLNRRMIYEKLEEEMQRAKRYGNDLSIILLNIDHFKKVNDTYGHLRGDHVLEKAAATILDKLRVVDYAGRYSGEEFLIILPNVNLSDAQNVAQRLSQSIQQMSFDEPDLKVTISGGLKDFADETSEEILESANALLIKAKKAGRNRIEF